MDVWPFPEDTDLIWGDSGALSHATLPRPWTLHGVRWCAHEAVVFLFGRIHEGWPEEDGVLDGVPYLRGETLRFDERGRLARCYLAADAELSGAPCRAETRVYLDGDGGLIEGTLARDVTLGGVPAAEGSVVRFAHGSPLTVTPREDCEVDGIPCAAGHLVILTAGGGVRLAMLSRARVTRGFTAPARSVLELDDHGEARMLIMTDGLDPEGNPLAGCWTLLWDAQGALRWRLPSDTHGSRTRVQLRKESSLDGIPAAAMTAVTLSDDSALRELVLARNHRLGALPCLAQTRVRLDEEGRPQSVFLARDAVIQGVPCARAQTLTAVMNDVERMYQETVQLHPDGAVLFATLSEDAVIDGVPLAKGRTVALHPNGRLQVGTLSQPWTHPLGHVAAAGSLLGLFDDGAPSLITLAEPFDGHPQGTSLRFEAPGAHPRAERASVPLESMERVVE